MSETTFLPRRVASVALIFFAFLAPALAQTTSTEVTAIRVREHPADVPRSAPLGINDYEKLLAIDPGDAISQNNLGALYFEAGRYEEALDLIKKAADAKPDMWNIQVNASIALSNKMDFANGLKYAQAAFALAPKEIRVRQQLCDMYLAVQDGAEAVPCFDALVKDDSGDAEDLLGYGEALLLTGEPARAETAIRQVVTTSPRLASAYNALGMAAYKQKHYRDSVNSFREAVRLAPAEATYRFNMAVAEMADRDRPGALSQYNLLKRSDPKLADKLYQMMFADKLVAVGH